MVSNFAQDRVECSHAKILMLWNRNVVSALSRYSRQPQMVSLFAESACTQTG